MEVCWLNIKVSSPSPWDIYSYDEYYMPRLAYEYSVLAREIGLSYGDANKRYGLHPYGGAKAFLPALVEF